MRLSVGCSRRTLVSTAKILEARRIFLLASGAFFLATSAVAQQPGYSGLGAESVTPATIAKYAPPPLDPAVSRRIQALLDVRTPGMGAVSPDGKRLYFSWDVTGSGQVWRLDGPNSFPIQMTGGEDATGVRAITAGRQVARPLA